MDKDLRNKMIEKARENGAKFGKKAELDFGAGAEWMYKQLVKNCSIPDVSQQRELLLAFIKFYHSDDYSPENTTFKEDVDAFLEANNCG